MSVGDHLYFDYATQLQEINSTLIYTVPISAIYSDKNIQQKFSQPTNIMPMVNLYKFDPNRFYLKYNQTAIKKFTQLISRRIDPSAVFASDRLLTQLVIYSGEHVRQLMQMTASACLVAATRKQKKIQQEDVIYAIKQEQFNFERVIPAQHYPLLVQVCRTKLVEQDENGQRMLSNMSVLEYNGNHRWNYVNPVVKLSDAFKQALKHTTLNS